MCNNENFSHVLYIPLKIWWLVKTIMVEGEVNYDDVYISENEHEKIEIKKKNDLIINKIYNLIGDDKNLNNIIVIGSIECNKHEICILINKNEDCDDIKICSFSGLI